MTTRAISLVTTVLLALASPSAAQDHYVDAINGSDTAGDGSTLAPWRTLTHAVATAPAGANLWLAPGIYDAANGEIFPIWVNSQSIHGSTAGTTIIRSLDSDALRSDYLLAQHLVIEGDLAGPPAGIGVSVSNVLELDDCAIRGFSSAITPSGLGSNFVQLRRVTLEGTLSSSPCWSSHGVSTYDNGYLLISDSSIRGYSCGVYLEVNDFGPTMASASVEIVRSRLAGNGTALHASAWSSMGNAAYASVTAVNNLVTNNSIGFSFTAACDACAIGSMVAGSVFNNTFADQQLDAIVTTTFGPASTNVDVVNNIFAFNGGFGLDDQSPVSLIDTNLFAGNGAGDWRFGANSTPNNLFADPLFVQQAAGDYRLTPFSPAVDSATDSPLATDDIDGRPRPVDGDGDLVATTDIGAYERSEQRDLRRADFTTIEPLSPTLSTVFPFAASNPLTPVVRSFISSGDDDPTPGILSDLLRPLALYQVDPGAGALLLLTKDAIGDTIRVELQ